MSEANSITLPTTMKAIGLPTATGGIDLLQEFETSMPELKHRDILIKIEAVGMNPVDTKVRVGFGNPGPLESPKILGFDGVGTVVAKGSDTSLFKIGDRVWTAGVVNRNGTNADYMAVDERIVGNAPKSLPSSTAAAVPLTFLTAWEGIFEGMGIQPFANENVGKTLLILPGAGGVGSFVIQLAKKVADLTVIATASRPESEAACLALGADIVINHRKPLKEQLKEKGIEGVDYIYNAYEISGNFDQYCDIIKPLGKIVSIVETKSDLPITKLMAKRVTFVWELMFTRALFKVHMINQHHILNKGAQLVDSGLLKLPDVTVHPYSVESLRKLHEEQESGTVIGKQVMTKE